ncbi:MAG: hypothetical protein IJW91_05600 [Phascolarctobacterium sp.]|nr:hypothetical protein [Phascolarctobacterium sp.]MBQ7884394.1 hypothetical protein [Phascolarctobacterium sp.]
MEELYRETSTTANERKIFAGLALLAILALFGYEVTDYIDTGRINYLGWGIDLCLLCLWVWRVSYGYTLVLYKDMRLEVITHGLGLRRSYFVDLTRTESFTQKYEKSFFRKTKIRHYIHRYNSLDPNQQRLLVFTEGKNNKLAGLLFKSSDQFIKLLRRLMPDKYIQL